MEQNLPLTTSAEQKFGQIKAILYLLQTNLEEFKDEVDKSYELLKVGEMTDFSKKIETVLTNPVSHIFEISDNIDTQIKHIVHHFVLSFLQKNNSIINATYQTKTSLNDLHYTIILENDNIDNRNQIFDFFYIA